MEENAQTQLTNTDNQNHIEEENSKTETPLFENDHSKITVKLITEYALWIPAIISTIVVHYMGVTDDENCSDVGCALGNGITKMATAAILGIMLIVTGIILPIIFYATSDKEIKTLKSDSKGILTVFFFLPLIVTIILNLYLILT